MNRNGLNSGKINTLVYSAKLDLLYFIIFILSELVILVAAFLVLTKGYSPFNFILVGFFLIIGIGTAWMFLGIRYIIDARWLEFIMGPFRTKVLLSEIQAVSKTRSILSSWAVSINRLKLRTRRGIYEISPMQPEEFINTIHERNPAIRIDEESIEN